MLGECLVCGKPADIKFGPSIQTFDVADLFSGAGICPGVAYCYDHNPEKKKVFMTPPFTVWERSEGGEFTERATWTDMNEAIVDAETAVLGGYCEAIVLDSKRNHVHRVGK